MSSKVWFTSDLHFDHSKLVSDGFRGRCHSTTFVDVEESDEYLIDRWNTVVNKRDSVWVLGDVAWSSKGLSKFSRLNGTKFLVLGNHDKRATAEYLRYFNKVFGVVRKYGLVMSHVPVHPSEMVYRWKLNVHGHIHHKDRLIDDPRYYCVNVDVQQGVPVSKDYLLEKLNELE